MRLRSFLRDRPGTTSTDNTDKRKRVVFKSKKPRKRAALNKADGDVETKSKPSYNEEKSDFKSSEPVVLTNLQRNALDDLAVSAAKKSQEAMPALLKQAQELNISQQQLDNCLMVIRDKARLLIHVDLPTRLELLLADTHYRSQFETGTSKGDLSSAHRTFWERRMFGSAYDNASNAERVKYGTIDLQRRVRKCRLFSDLRAFLLCAQGFCSHSHKLDLYRQQHPECRGFSGKLRALGY